MGKEQATTTFSLDPNKSPKQFDLRDFKNVKTAPGMYILDGDSLTVCIGQERPTSFETAGKEVALIGFGRNGSVKRADKPSEKVKEPPKVNGKKYYTAMRVLNGMKVTIHNTPVGDYSVSVTLAPGASGGLSVGPVPNTAHTYSVLIFDGVIEQVKWNNEVVLPS